MAGGASGLPAPAPPPTCDHPLPGCIMDPTGTTKQAQTMVTLLIELLRQLAAGADEYSAVELPLAQLRVCLFLSRSPANSSLGRELAVSLSGMTQLADRLERASWSNA